MSKGTFYVQGSDGEKIAVNEDFTIETEKVSVSDLFLMVQDSDVFKKMVAQLEAAQKMFGVNVNDGRSIAKLLTLAIVLISILAYLFVNSVPPKETNSSNSVEEAKAAPLRDFTVQQLSQYNGKEVDKPIYISLKRDVFDVTSARDFYGKDCSYNCFAGREATRAMAKLSFDEAELSNLDTSDLGPFEVKQMEEWYEKFKYFKVYPIVGKLSVPPSGLKISRDELSKYNGLQAVPDGRIDAPIYVGLKGKIIDVSYGGREMYGEGGGYHLFAGIDASKSLAKMSFEADDISSSDLSDLTPDQQKCLDDWFNRLTLKYPVVGDVIV